MRSKGKSSESKGKSSKSGGKSLQSKVKGWLGFHLKMDKISLEFFQAFIAALNDHLVEINKGNVKKTNESLRVFGRKMAESLLISFSEKMKEHAGEFKGLKDILSLVYKVFTGSNMTNVWYDEDRKTIVFADADCPFCTDVTLSENLTGLKYCAFIGGLFEEVARLQGFTEVICEEVSCKTWNDQACVYHLRLLK